MKTRETRKTQNNYFNAILFLICFLKLKIFCKTLITRHLKLVLYNLRDSKDVKTKAPSKRLFHYVIPTHPP